MLPQEIINLRLSNQILLSQKYKEPWEVVSHLCATQAQDYLGSLWAVALRTENSSELDIEKAIAAKTIVRTWPMRGTLHYVAPPDARWMLNLMARRIMQNSTKRLKRDYDIDETVLSQSRSILIKALQGGKQLARSDVYKVLEEGGIAATGQRGLHIIGQLAMEGLICFGSRMGKQPSFVLLDEWVPVSRVLTHEESLAEIALRYFKSRGPATITDFIWWTGLTASAARQALELAKSQLTSFTFSEKTYWLSPDTKTPAIVKDEMHLLPPFDEYLIAYSDRSLMLGDYTLKEVVPFSNGIFFPVIMEAGKLLGTWKRTLQKKTVDVELKPLRPLTKAQEKKTDALVKKYTKFLGY